jgi:Na+-driven multidrug efflux pump
VFENILQTSVGFVDSILIAKISLVAVSAVSLVNGVMAVYQAVFIALAVAVATVVSNAAGARSGLTFLKTSGNRSLCLCC